MKYSVIIPVYNERTAIHRCLDSVLPQLPENAEVLLIDDGSTDGTVEICREYAAKFPCITLVEKINVGVSSARNAGLDIAKGEYVLFVDADDAVASDYFDTLDTALADSPDMLMFDMRIMGKRDTRMRKCGRDGICIDRERMATIISKCLRRQVLNLITTKAFRREIIEKYGLRFDERLDIGEDKAFAFAFSLKAESVKKIRDELYYLSVDDPNSLSRRKRDKLCESVLTEHRIMSDMLRAADIPESGKRAYEKALNYSFYRSAYTVVGELNKFDLTKTERREKTREILEAFSREEGFEPKDIRCAALACPVRNKKVRLMDGAMRRCSKRGRL
ncbi:MAG: glycosyltransferase [Clostridia bacterium]|nr:glycosyltransferase [Clostridia bacterium]